MKKVLDGKIVRVEVSTRLVDSPATLVQSEYGVSPTMQKYLRAQAGILIVILIPTPTLTFTLTVTLNLTLTLTVVDSEDKGEFSNIFNQAVLEINPEHPIIARLKAMQEADPESEDAKDIVKLVFNTAALAAGYVLDNSAEYSQMVTKMMSKLASKQ